MLGLSINSSDVFGECRGIDRLSLKGLEQCYLYRCSLTGKANTVPDWSKLRQSLLVRSKYYFFYPELECLKYFSLTFLFVVSGGWSHGASHCALLSSLTAMASIVHKLVLHLSALLVCR